MGEAVAKKTKTLPQLIEKAAVLLQLYVRIKASDDNGYVSCVTCGVTRHYKDEMQGAHFISRTWISTKLLEENVHPCCSSCNGGFGGKPKGNMVAYTLYMVDMYGRGFVEELEVMKHKVKKYTKQEVLDYISDMREKIKLLENP